MIFLQVFLQWKKRVFPFSIIFFWKLKAVWFPWVILPLPSLLLSWAAGGVCTRSCARAGGIIVVLFPEGSKAPFFPWEYKFLVLSCYVYGAAVMWAVPGCVSWVVLLSFGWPQDNEDGAGGWRLEEAGGAGTPGVLLLPGRVLEGMPGSAQQPVALLCSEGLCSSIELWVVCRACVVLQITSLYSNRRIIMQPTRGIQWNGLSLQK